MYACTRGVERRRREEENCESLLRLAFWEFVLTKYKNRRNAALLWQFYSAQWLWAVCVGSWGEG